jgi:hypothetical protein
MSDSLSAPPPAGVFRPRYLDLRALLAVATAVVVGLAVAAVLLATSTDRVTTSVPDVSSSAQTADLGARLDHRGLNRSTYVEAISSLTPRTIAAAFGTERIAPTTQAPNDKRYVEAIARLNAAHLAAGFDIGATQANAPSQNDTRYVNGITSLSAKQMTGAYGTTR